jgi:hypothetical protein
VHRFFSAFASDYVYTTSAGEFAALSQSSSGFAYDGVAFYAFSKQQPGTAAIHRFYSNSASDHLYTANYEEGANASGYRYEGVAWYAIDL